MRALLADSKLEEMGAPLGEDHPTYTLPDLEGEGDPYGAADDPYSKLDTSLVPRTPLSLLFYYSQA